MKSPQLRRLTLLLFFVFFVLFNSSLAQHFVKMTDQQWVELALDMIRKGIQQQDTTKVFMVVAPEVMVKGKGIESKAILSRKLQTIFNNSYKRNNQLEKPSFPREDNPLHLSNFWDFDILDPQIKIVGDPAEGGNGDSAVVDCELVLWGASAAKGSDRTVGDPARGGSRRTKERFVFQTPLRQAQGGEQSRTTPEVEKAPPSGDYRKWPAAPSGKKRISSIRSWKLVSFENLLDFLNGEAVDSNKQDKQREGK